MERNRATVAGDGAGSTQGPASSSFTNQWVSEYRQKQAFLAPNLIKLPSGKSVSVMRMPLALMYQKGLIPDIFTARVSEWITTIQENLDDPIQAGKDFLGTESEDEEAIRKRYQDWLDIVDYVWCACVVEPRFCVKEDDQDLSVPLLWVGEVDYQDKVYIYSYAQGVDQTVEEFFREQEEIMGALLDGEGVSGTSKQLLRVERKGGKLDSVHDRPRNIHVGPLHSGED